jgi:hypothetical protein
MPKGGESGGKKGKTAPVTIDDILGPNMATIESVNSKIIEKDVAQGDSNELITNIDKILNDGMVKFDNKIQTSMYFVCYKALTAMCNGIKGKYNMTIAREFLDKHIIEEVPKIIKEYTGNLKKRSKKAVSDEMICIGRKLDNKQCTRKKHNGTDFCKSHLAKLSNGRIDEPIVTVKHNKRGRKRKVEFDPRQYDNEYITLWEDIVNGEKVLVDTNNNMYTFDMKAPRYIGKKEINTKLDLANLIKNADKEVTNEEKCDAVVPAVTPSTEQKQKTNLITVNEDVIPIDNIVEDNKEQTEKIEKPKNKIALKKKK